MSDEVKKVDQAASTGEEVKKDDVAASTTNAETDLDLAEELVKALERAAKAETDRDNYKEGMLKAKGKLKTDETATDETGSTDSAAATSGLQPLLRRIKELETAAANRTQISTAGQGAGSETTMKVGDNMLSSDQIKALQAKGWDDKKIARFKQNLINSRA